MTLVSRIIAKIRGSARPNYGEIEDGNPINATNGGELIIAQGLPELVEIVRLGNSYHAITSTGQAALTALPTTVAGLSLINKEQGGGKSYIIDSFGSWEAVVDATQTDVTALFAMIGKSTDTIPTGTAETGIASLSGKSAYGGKGTITRGGTVINNLAWIPHSTEGAQMAAAAAGANWKVNEARVRGLYIVPPGGAFNIQAVKAAAAAAAQQFFFVRWHEAQLVLG